MEHPGNPEYHESAVIIDQILRDPNSFIGSPDKFNRTMWIYENNKLIELLVSYKPGFFNVFDQILLNAVDRKQKDRKMDRLKVEIDVDNNLISVFNNGRGISLGFNKDEKMHEPRVIFGNFGARSFYDYSLNNPIAGRSEDGAKLSNVFSEKFVIMVANGLMKYKQVFSNNMKQIDDHIITKCKESEIWTKISAKPDFQTFEETHLEDDLVALMKQRVSDVAACLGRSVNVELNGVQVLVQSFTDYVQLFLVSANNVNGNPRG